MKICVVILAAGESKRLGQAKQFLKFKGTSFIRNIVDQCRQLDVYDTLMITGSLHSQLQEEFKDDELRLYYNKDYKEGMHSSLIKGIELVSIRNEIDACLIVLCDQPLVDVSHYQVMIQEAKKRDQQIIATSYADNFGAPAIFKKSLFKTFGKIKKGSGAKLIIEENRDIAHFIKCEAAGFDVDTLDDYQQLLKRQ